MSAPTLWEEGRTAGGRLVWLSAAGCLALMILDVLVFDRLSPLFDVCFVLLCIAAALAVRPRDFFTAGVMPPFLMLGVLAVLAVRSPGAIAAAGDGVGQALVAGLAHHSGALFAADVNVLVVIAIRARIASVRRDREARRTSPYAVAPTERAPERDAQQPAGHSKREGSPAPTLVTSAVPEEKSTTVVGSDDVSPASRTASSF